MRLSGAGTLNNSVLAGGAYVAVDDVGGLSDRTFKP
jgi:hypothetical protein